MSFTANIVQRLTRVFKPVSGSLLYLILDMAGRELDAASASFMVGLLQLNILAAEGMWLDFWGDYFGIVRLPSETDEAYGQRIFQIIFKPKQILSAINGAVAPFYPTGATLLEYETNGVQNPSFEDGTLGSLPTNWTLTGTGTLVKSLDPNSSPKYDNYVGALTTDGTVQTAYQIIPLIASQGWRFSFSIWLKSSVTMIPEIRLSESGGHYSTSLGITNPGSSPTLSQNPGGNLPITTYFVAYTWVNAQGETLASPEASITVLAGNLLTVTIPSIPSSATAANIYIGAASGSETLQATIVSTSWTQPISPILVSGRILPGANTTSNSVSIQANSDWVQVYLSHYIYGSSASSLTISVIIPSSVANGSVLYLDGARQFPFPFTPQDALSKLFPCEFIINIPLQDIDNVDFIFYDTDADAHPELASYIQADGNITGTNPGDAAYIYSDATFVGSGISDDLIDAVDKVRAAGAKPLFTNLSAGSFGVPLGGYGGSGYGSGYYGG